MSSQEIIARVVSCLITLQFLVHPEWSFSADLFTEDGSCPPIEDVMARKDYRLRESTHILRVQAKDTYRSHVAPAVSRITSGDFSTPVIDDLNFTLARWPNHYPALLALIDFVQAGGRTDKYVQVSCYFQRANRFVPDDANVYVLYGIYQQRRNQEALAEASWKQALIVNEDAVEAHYNLGLLYFRRKDFDRSSEHAKIAYEMGYPLPGLRRNLARVGRWN